MGYVATIVVCVRMSMLVLNLTAGIDRVKLTLDFLKKYQRCGLYVHTTSL